MTVLKKEWLEDKVCVDVGCNVGNVTMEVAEKFHCAAMQGIDIDGVLIQRARSFLWQRRQSLIQTAGLLKKAIKNGRRMETSGDAHKDDRTELQCTEKGLQSLSKTRFNSGNYVLSTHEKDESAACILCLSVT